MKKLPKDFLFFSAIIQLELWVQMIFSFFLTPTDAGKFQRGMKKRREEESGSLEFFSWKRFSFFILLKVFFSIFFFGIKANKRTRVLKQEKNPKPACLEKKTVPVCFDFMTDRNGQFLYALSPPLLKHFGRS